MPLVYFGNFPDPFVLRVPEKGFYAYGTNGKLGNVQLLQSYNLSKWREVGDAMSSLPNWATSGRTWAPEVLPLTDGRWAMYYTARCTASNRQAIGVALADSPEGPFVDAAGRPLVDQDEGGSIDASPFVDVNGKTYLLWKNDGNAIGVDTWIYLQEMDPDNPTRLTGKAVRLIKQDQSWEGKMVEGPFLWLRDRRYYLFYSANAFDKSEYGEGYAMANSVTGPYTKAPENPILRSRSDAIGPGHASMFEHGGRTWLGYHAWSPDDVGGPTGRQFWIDELTWIDGRPIVRV
jgi:beta-xylosidase